MRIIRLYRKRFLWFVFFNFVILGYICLLTAFSLAQDNNPTPIPDEPPLQPPSQVEVEPTARDAEIETRLQDILDTTGWFENPQVRVQDGVVFLMGITDTAEFRDWAGDLARNTQDVVVVVNQLEVSEPPVLDFEPVVNGLRDQGRRFLRSAPLIIFSLIILFAAWFVARFANNFAKQYLETRVLSALLRNVIARTIRVIVFLAGLYLVFQIAGLTSIALTILGGTGLLGLVLGIAFRDITENFLASIFLSIQNPFKIGDLVEMNEVVGFVQRMTTRTTILMTLSGNHVQVPNSTVYKSIIHNYTSNPNRQIDFTIGIGYDDSISLAQEIIRGVLNDHPAVLNDPEHLILVDSLGSATVNLQIYFWLDGLEHSWLKVKSSVIRLVKKAIQDAGISMPDEARELIFPQGVPVRMLDTGQEYIVPDSVSSPQPTRAMEDDSVSTTAEGGLRSEAPEIELQARQSRSPEAGENLLKN